tara:strand:+ start:374 stop:841 length:468 start_codon:yes stop_codon:yes gene_type:complete
MVNTQLINGGKKPNNITPLIGLKYSASSDFAKSLGFITPNPEGPPAVCGAAITDYLYQGNLFTNPNTCVQAPEGAIQNPTIPSNSTFISDYQFMELAGRLGYTQHRDTTPRQVMTPRLQPIFIDNTPPTTTPKNNTGGIVAVVAGILILLALGKS